MVLLVLLFLKGSLGKQKWFFYGENPLWTLYFLMFCKVIVLYRDVFPLFHWFNQQECAFNVKVFTYRFYRLSRAMWFRVNATLPWTCKVGFEPSWLHLTLPLCWKMKQWKIYGLFLSDEQVCQSLNCVSGVMFWVTAQSCTQIHSCTIKAIWKTTPYYAHTTDFHILYINTIQPAKHLWPTVERDYSECTLTHARLVNTHTGEITKNILHRLHSCRHFSKKHTVFKGTFSSIQVKLYGWHLSLLSIITANKSISSLTLQK